MLFKFIEIKVFNEKGEIVDKGEKIYYWGLVLFREDRWGIC